MTTYTESTVESATLRWLYTPDIGAVGAGCVAGGVG